MAQAPSGNEAWLMRWNARSARSAAVHLAHSAAVLVLTLLVPPPAGPWLRYVWMAAAFFSVMALILLLRLGDYEGTTDEEVGSLIRQSYWVATGTYLSLLAISLYFILRQS